MKRTTEMEERVRREARLDKADRIDVELLIESVLERVDELEMDLVILDPSILGSGGIPPDSSSSSSSAEALSIAPNPCLALTAPPRTLMRLGREGCTTDVK